MKKLFVFMAFLPLAAGCIAEYSEVSPVTAQKLQSYSKKVMSETVMHIFSSRTWRKSLITGSLATVRIWGREYMIFLIIRQESIAIHI